MKTIKISGSNVSFARPGGRLGLAAWAILAALGMALTGLAGAESKSTGIPLSEIGARATADYQGEALEVVATAEGARLRCGFQKLEGRATAEGLWLTSIAEGAKGERLRVVALAVGRRGGGRTSNIEHRTSNIELPASGSIVVADKLVRFVRPGLVEEYSVSVDGVRQDFVVTERPEGEGELRVELGLSGARAEAAGYGAKLRLEGSGRELAYSRLRAVDARGKELKARMEVLTSNSESRKQKAEMAVVVEDGAAVYPVRIDPTFSDADWVSLNPGMPGANSPVFALAADGSGNVYVGGNFSFIGTVAANYIAKWNGSTWSALGSGMNVVVQALAVSGTNLYAGGSFTRAGGVAANYVAKWDGTAWSALGEGVDSDVWLLAASATDVYAGGYFTSAGGVAATNIAKWDGSTWSALGSGINGEVNALAASTTDLYAGGYFTNAGGVTASNIAKWDGSAWSALGSGINGYVEALAVSETNLYAGGYFDTAGGVAATNIAKWDGSGWSALGSGISGEVYALAESGTNLYAGGYFDTAGGVAATNIARWDGSAWSGLGLGISGSYNWGAWVGALAASGTELYVGGDFTMAGGVEAECIAKWDGNAWSALGSGMNRAVSALAVDGTTLYVGGEFTTAGGVMANRIAKWDGNTWSALGSGLNDQVNALAVSGTNLYAGGDFTTAGGVTVNYIAKWDGSTWSALGSGMGYWSDHCVRALAVMGTNLYAGGNFDTAGGIWVNCIAKWDGNAWSALGSGMSSIYRDAYVFALAVSGANLYAGGIFDTAGGVWGLTALPNGTAAPGPPWARG